jgi:hypothetical protein
MDPITTAIVAALPALATDAVKSAYTGLKAVIERKWGEGSPLSKAVNALEEDPESKAQVGVLQEKVAATRAVEEPDILQPLKTLVDALQANAVGGSSVASINFTMSGGKVEGVAGAGTVNIHSMTFGAPRTDDPSGTD